MGRGGAILGGLVGGVIDSMIGDDVIGEGVVGGAIIGGLGEELIKGNASNDDYIDFVSVHSKKLQEMWESSPNAIKKRYGNIDFDKFCKIMYKDIRG